MMQNTLLLMKPDAIANNIVGHILAMIEKAGFDLVAMKLTQFNPTTARAFYNVHEGKFFLEGLVKFMCSGRVIVIVLRKENAIKDLRKLVGPTDPVKAEEGTIRKKYATSTRVNAVHASDSIEAAEREIKFFFSQEELLHTL